MVHGMNMCVTWSRFHSSWFSFAEHSNVLNRGYKINAKLESIPNRIKIFSALLIFSFKKNECFVSVRIIKCWSCILHKISLIPKNDHIALGTFAVGIKCNIQSFSPIYFYFHHQISPSISKIIFIICNN